MTNATTNVARVAAAVAGLGLVAMSFAPLAGAATTTTTTTTTTTATFTRDLTIGSTGADVTALQAWLIAKGFSIPAGATGYFGAQTKAALAAYQAANMISPAVGYFGPITRAKVAAAGGSTTSSTPGCGAGDAYSSITGQACGTTTTTGDLSGGEANFRNYDLVTGDSLKAGDTDTEIAIAKFDVKGGDANLQRVTIEMQPTSSSYSQKPWDYIDTLSVYNGNKKVGSISAGSKDDWDKINDDGSHNASGNLSYYSIDVPLSSIVREDDKVELSIRADAQSTIDTTDLSQTFVTDIATDGIRAVDSKGIQQYVGTVSDTTTVTFDAELSGDLSITKTSDSPSAGVLVGDSTQTTTGFDLLAFQIKNKDAADVTVNSLKFSIATTTAVGSSAANIKNIVRKATLDLDGDTFTGTVNTDNTILFDNMDANINADDTVKGTLTVDLYSQTSHYAAAGESLKATLTGTATYVDAEGADTGDALGNSKISGSAVGNVQTIATDAGINVSGNSSNAVLTYNSNDTTKSYGTYTLKFDVTASGDDVYVPKTVASTTGLGATVGVAVDTNLNTTFVGTSTFSMSSEADTDGTGPSYVVHDGETKTFTVTATLDPSTTGTYSVGLDKVRYSTSADLSSLQTLEIDQTQSEFNTDALSIQN